MKLRAMILAAVAGAGVGLLGIGANEAAANMLDPYDYVCCPTSGGGAYWCDCASFIANTCSNPDCGPE